VRLKFLIAINRAINFFNRAIKKINRAIKKLIAINLIINRRVKTRQYVSIIIQSTVHFTQKLHPQPLLSDDSLAILITFTQINFCLST